MTSMLLYCPYLLTLFKRVLLKLLANKQNMSVSDVFILVLLKLLMRHKHKWFMHFSPGTHHLNERQEKHEYNVKCNIFLSLKNAS